MKWNALPWIDIPEPAVAHCPEYIFLTAPFFFVFFLVFLSFPVFCHPFDLSPFNFFGSLWPFPLYFLPTSILSSFSLFFHPLPLGRALSSYFSSHFQSFFPFFIFFILCRPAVSLSFSFLSLFSSFPLLGFPSFPLLSLLPSFPVSFCSLSFPSSFPVSFCRPFFSFPISPSLFPIPYFSSFSHDVFLLLCLYPSLQLLFSFPFPLFLPFSVFFPFFSFFPLFFPFSSSYFPFPFPFFLPFPLLPFPFSLPFSFLSPFSSSSFPFLPSLFLSFSLFLFFLSLSPFPFPFFLPLPLLPFPFSPLFFSLFFLSLSPFPFLSSFLSFYFSRWIFEFPGENLQGGQSAPPAPPAATPPGHSPHDWLRICLTKKASKGYVF